MSLQQNCLKEINTNNLDIINITEDLYTEEMDYNGYNIKKGGENSSDEELGSSDSSEQEENSSDRELGSSDSSNKKENSSDKELGASDSSEQEEDSSDRKLGSSDSTEDSNSNISDEEMIESDILEYEEEVNHLNTENINIGDYIKIECQDKKNKLNNKKGDVLFRSSDKFVFRDNDQGISYILECKLFEISYMNGVSKVIVLKDNQNLDYLAWKDIIVGSRIKISGNEYLKEGTVVKNINKIIEIEFDEKHEDNLSIDLSNGLDPESGLYNIERVNVDIEETENDGIEILEDQDLQEILEIVPIPEEERLYSNKEEFNDMFENLIGEMKPNQINRLVENEIKKSIEMFIQIRDQTTSYSTEKGKIETVINKKKGYKQAVKDILNHNFDNISLIPIINDKKKIYVGTESLIENDSIYQVNFNKEMENISQITTEYLNGDYNSLGNSFDMYYKSKNNLENPNKPSGNGYEYFTKKDLLVSRNCFENPCEYINEKNTSEGGIGKLNFSLRKSLSSISRPIDSIIKEDNQDKTERVDISNPEKINIIGFISFPDKVYNNKNFNNIENLRELYSKYNYIGENYNKYLQNNKTSIDKVYLNKKYTNINDLNEDDINRKFKLLISIDEESVYFEGKLLRIEGDEYFFRNLDDDSDEADIEEFVTYKNDERITSVEILQTKYLQDGDINKNFRIVFRNSEDSENNLNFEGKLVNVTEDSYFFEPLDEEIIKVNGNEPQEFDKDNEDIVSIDEIFFKNNEIQIFLFENNSGMITNKELENFCEQIVPNISKILENSVNKHKIINNSDIQKYLSKYNISINNVHAEEYTQLTQLIEENVSKYIKDKKKENDYYLTCIKDYKKNLQIFKDKMSQRDFDFFPNKYFSNTLIKEYYQKYNYNELLPDNGIFRMTWLDSQPDFGLLFYKIVALEENKEISSKEKIKQMEIDYENTLKELTSKLENVEKKLLEKQKNIKKINSHCEGLSLTKIYNSYEALNNDNGKEIFYDKDLDSTPFNIKEKILSENPPEIVESPRFIELLKYDIQKKYTNLKEEEVDIIIADINNGGKKVKIGDLCLLKDGTNRVFERAVLGNSQDDIWILSNVDVSSNQDLCNQQGKSLGELEISDLDKEETCGYQQGKCISNDEIRMNTEIKNIQCQISSVEEGLKKIKDIDNYKHKIEDDKNYYMEKIIRYKKMHQHFLDNQERDYQKIKKKYSSIKKSHSSKIFKVLKKIMSERNILKRNINLNKLLYNMKYVRFYIEGEDPNWLYTQDTNEKLISVHWLLKIRITLEPEKAPEIIQEMIDKYGVYESGSEQIVSKIDGDPLREIDNEIFEGFEDDEGGFKNTREILIQDQDFSFEKSLNVSYSKDSLEYEIYLIISNFSKSIFIELNKGDIEEIVNDTSSILKSQYLGNPEEWKQNKIEKGFTASTKKSYYIDENKYKNSKSYRLKINKKIDDDYEDYKYKLLLFSSISRLFIQLQTAIPEYKPESIYAGCNYSLRGYPLTELDNPTETNGITYMVCVLQGLSLGNKPWSIIKSWKKLKTRSTIIEWIDLWIKETTKLTERYKFKIEEEKIRVEKDIDMRDTQDYWSDFKPNLSGTYTLKENHIDLKLIQKNIISANEKTKREMLRQLESRNNWLSSQILNEINIILSKNNLEYVNQLGIPLVQNACCYSNININNNYLDFFMEKSEKLPLFLHEMMEIQKLYNTYAYLYVNPLHLVNKYPYQLTENNSNIIPIKIKEKDIYSLFLMYSNQPLSFGQRRIFNKLGRCLITGQISQAYLPNLTLEERVEALKKEVGSEGGYSIEEYNLFLQNLYKSNIFTYTTNEFHDNFIKNIKEMVSKYPFLSKNNDEEEEDFIDPIQFLIEKLSKDMNNEEFIYVLQEFNDFIKLEIDSIMSKIDRVLILEKNTSNILKKILENIGFMERNYKENIIISQSIKEKIQKAEENKDINKINLIKNYIQKYILTNISKIKNRKNTLIINVPKSWKISEDHSDIVKKSIEINSNYLTKYMESDRYSDPNYKKMFEDILNNISDINFYINRLIGQNNRENCAGKIVHFSPFSTKSCSMLIQYIFLRILNYIIRKEGFDLLQMSSIEYKTSKEKNESSSSSKKSEKISSSSNEKIVQNLLEDEELEIVDEINMGDKIHKDKILCNFIKDTIQQIYIDQQILDVTDTDLIASIGKSKEEEKTKFVTRLDKKADEIMDTGLSGNKEELATQLREVDRELKKYKIGPVWSRGIGYKGEYSQDEYKDLREKEDFERNTENIAKKKFGRELDEEEMQLFQTRMIKNKRIAKDVILENYNLQAIPGDAVNVPGIFIDPGYGGTGGIPGGLVERQGGLQYGDDQQNLEDYGDGNDGAGANVGMRLA